MLFMSISEVINQLLGVNIKFKILLLFVLFSSFLIFARRLLYSLPSTRSSPDIFLLGAAKAGTSQLYGLLAKHPDICSSGTKEKHFFDLWDGKTQQAISAYKKQYADCFSGQLTIDATPKYLRDNHSYTQITYYYTPQELVQKKFIVVLKDPIEREYSWYNHCYRKCVKYFTEQQLTTKISNKYSCNKNISRVYEDTFSNYLKSGRHQREGSLYVDQLLMWLQSIQRSQLFVINTETLLFNASDTLQRLQRFLHLAPIHVWGLKRRSTSVAPMKEQDREYLRRMYAAPTEQLYRLLRMENSTKPADEPYFPEFRNRY